MTQNLTEDFINLSNRGLGSDTGSKFGLNHVEGSFYIRPLMVMSQKLFPIEVVVVPRSLPETIICAMPLRSGAVGLERDIRRSVYSYYSVEILFAGISLISRHFINIERLNGSIQQLG